MELLQAVNTVLPHLGEHVITRIEGAKHPTVDLILSAIDRQRTSLLAEGLWFNELELTLTPSPEGVIDVPKDTIAVYGIDCDVELDGEQLFNLQAGTREFKEPIKVKIVRDIPFNRLPANVALCVTYRAGAEVYLQDYGVEASVTALHELANMNWVSVTQENLRKRKFNSQKKTRQRFSGAIRFR